MTNKTGLCDPVLGRSVVEMPSPVFIGVTVVVVLGAAMGGVVGVLVVIAAIVVLGAIVELAGAAVVVSGSSVSVVFGSSVSAVSVSRVSIVVVDGSNACITNGATMSATPTKVPPPWAIECQLLAMVDNPTHVDPSVLTISRSMPELEIAMKYPLPAATDCQ